ncbi:MAG: ATP-binding protein [Lachnospiraceae bacterium]
MFVDFILFAVIALATGIIILIRILSSNMRYQEKGFLQLIILSICHNVIDIFWGLTYFDKIGMGPLGLKISTSLYFCSNAILAFTWFTFLYRLLQRDKPQKWVSVLSGIPLALVIFMVIANIKTGALFTIGDTVESYARGQWYIIERIGTTGYLIVIFIWSVIKFFQAEEKSERKKYIIITSFAIVPMVFDLIQVLFVAVPCTSVAFQIAIIIVYVFISVERSENVLISASERQKNNMKTALAQTSMSWYEFNVDRDCIYDSKIYIEKDRYVKRLDEESESYSEYYEFLGGRVFSEYKELYKNTFSLENLKKCFEQGESELSLRYWIKDSLGEEIYILQNMILTQDNVTKEIIGFAYTRDITAEEIQKREIEKQLEEIKSLNSILEDKQFKLEELGAEQEAQIEEIQSMNEELCNRIAQIQSMSKVYFASFYVDVVNDSFEEISNIPSVRSVIGVVGKAQEALYTFCNKMVVPETTENMQEFVNLSTINERMKDTDVVTCEYVGITSGWSQLYMIAGDRDLDGNIKTLFVASRTIHEEKQREEKQNKIIKEARIAAENANNAKTAFLFNMSHDIRTPMNAIVGYAELMKKEIHNPEKLMDYQKKIQMSSEFLLSLLNAVLDMARIESGNEQLDETFYNTPETIISEVIRVFETQAKEKNITLKGDVDVEHANILCDIVKEREILTNLISNAIKYTPAGGQVQVNVREIPSNREGYVVYRTVVEDNGIGISKDFLPYIFDSFSRERNTTQGKVAGTGLGMAIVKALVELMNGTIEVESELGVGTKFILTIPHKIAQSVYYDAPEKKAVPNQIIFSGRRILLAEDNDLNAEIAIEFLRDKGFLVERATDGIVCIDMLQKSETDYYDLILMDIQMPNMDGYKATRIIRRMEDAYRKNIPIVAMTANAFEEDKKMALDAGMNGHLSKPIKIDELMGTLTEILRV